MIQRTAAGIAVCLALGACTSATPVATPSASGNTTASPAISTEWAQYHRDSARSGAGPSEPAIDHPQVAWSVDADADVYASPLIVGGHVIVATENNTVYSLSVFTGSTVWQRHLGDPVDASTLPCGNIGPVTGVTGTPAADPTSQRLYVVAYVKGYHHVLFALSLVDGRVLWSQDIDPPGSTPKAQQLRGALAIGSGFVYVPFGGLFGDCGEYHGYVVGVPLGGGQARRYTVPSGRGASIWAPQGVTVAADGSAYVVTGNATSSASTFGYSDSVIQLSPDLQTVRSYFAPSNWVALNGGDVDLGSTGAALSPTLDRVVVVGKEGIAYLLKAGSLGGIGGQVASRKVCAGALGGTAWSGSSLLVPCSDGLFALTVTSTSVAINWSVGQPKLGSPIVAAGAVWSIDASSATLYALDPMNGKTLYRTELGTSMHFATPAATEGFVVAPAAKKIVAISVVGG